MRDRGDLTTLETVFEDDVSSLGQIDPGAPSRSFAEDKR